MVRLKKDEKVKPDEVELDKLKTEYAQKEVEKEPESATPQVETPIAATTEPTKRRGRPKGSKNRPKDGVVEGSNLVPPAVVKAILKAPYSLVASKRGEHWNLSDADAEMMVPIHLQLIEKYLPQYLQEHAALYSALLMHGMIVFARVEIDMKLQKEKSPQVDVTKEADSNVGRSDNIGQAGFGKIDYLKEEVKPRN